ncbi:hypothetical protein [Streptomyces sp. NPDC051219]|uniref:hypothetical protein n=1 Tax=Streptomyces sp. NPDC051219 TaxID=3155283 RepID=UPI0034287ADB
MAEGNEEGPTLLASLKRDPGAVGLDSLLTEITKLTSVRKFGLPEGRWAASLTPRVMGCGLGGPMPHAITRFS